MDRINNAVSVFIIAVVTVIYATAFILLTSITVYLSMGFSIIVIYIQSEYNLLNKITNKIIDLIIKVYGE